jgi:hypothetical protein
VGLFGRKKDPRDQLAAAIAKRGVRARGTIDSIRETGAAPNEYEAMVSFTPEGGAASVVRIVQAMPPQTLHGLEPGEPVDISYDRDDPSVAMIWGSPKYKTIDGHVVRVEDVPPGH